MPARKKPTAAKPLPSSTKPQLKRSRLAKENNISAEKEAEIKEAWKLFAEEGKDDYEDEKLGIIRTEDVVVPLRALGLLPSKDEKLAELLDVLDPDQDGIVTYEPFLAVAALQYNSRTDEDKRAEIDRAFMLFTKGQDRPINTNDLRRVAKEVKVDVSDEELKDMILMFNNGAGLSAGVTKDVFHAIVDKGAL